MKATGELNSTVKLLNKAIDKQDTKLDKISASVSRLSHIIYAAGVVLVIIMAIAGFLLDASWDLLEAAIINLE